MQCTAGPFRPSDSYTSSSGTSAGRPRMPQLQAPHHWHGPRLAMLGTENVLQVAGGTCAAGRDDVRRGEGREVGRAPQRRWQGQCTDVCCPQCYPVQPPTRTSTSSPRRHLAPSRTDTLATSTAPPLTPLPRPAPACTAAALRSAPEGDPCPGTFPS